MELFRPNGTTTSVSILAAQPPDTLLDFPINRPQFQTVYKHMAPAPNDPEGDILATVETRRTTNADGSVSEVTTFDRVDGTKMVKTKNMLANGDIETKVVEFNAEGKMVLSQETLTSISAEGEMTTNMTTSNPEGIVSKKQIIATRGEDGNFTGTVEIKDKDDKVTTQGVYHYTLDQEGGYMETEESTTTDGTKILIETQTDSQGNSTKRIKEVTPDGKTTSKLEDLQIQSQYTVSTPVEKELVKPPPPPPKEPTPPPSPKPKEPSPPPTPAPPPPKEPTPPPTPPPKEPTPPPTPPPEVIEEPELPVEEEVYEELPPPKKVAPAPPPTTTSSFKRYNSFQLRRDVNKARSPLDWLGWTRYILMCCAPMPGIELGEVYIRQRSGGRKESEDGGPDLDEDLYSFYAADEHTHAPTEKTGVEQSVDDVY